MRKVWFDEAWADYLYWQTQDKKTLKRINKLIKEIERNGNEGIAKPEPLRGDLTGFWSRRIDDKNRFVYRLDNGFLLVLLAFLLMLGQSLQKSCYTTISDAIMLISTAGDLSSLPLTSRITMTVLSSMEVFHFPGPIFSPYCVLEEIIRRER